jgi:tRNA A37 threonylcarbamoyladenosine dehydratase
VVDAIDSTRDKCLLIALCRQKRIPLVTTGGAGGRRDPTALAVADLAFSSHDRLLTEVRRILRQDHGFPHGNEPFGVDCVFSREAPVFPQEDGTVCEKRGKNMDLRLDCNSGYGTASFVTGSFGFAAAARMVQRLASPEV